jgi:hypothetical protein
LFLGICRDVLFLGICRDVLQRCFVSWAFAERSLSLYILLDNDPTTTLLPYTIQTIQLYHHITFLYYYINPLI